MQISSSYHLQPFKEVLINEVRQPFKEVLINGVWLPYCECRVVPDDTIDPDTIKPSVAFPVKVLGVGVFEERIGGIVQNRLTRTHCFDGTPYVPETHIYWGLV